MVRLRRMTSEEYDAFLTQLIPSYAEDNVRSGRWRKEDALARSKRAHAELLPQGPETPGHHLYVLRAGGKEDKVGYLWIKIDESEDEAFIYQIQVFPEHRRKGYAAAAIRNAAADLKARGISRLGLHVFGFNEGAIKLYEKLGFEVTSLNMLKRL